MKFFGRNAQRLLVFLLLRPGQPLSRDRLASELWPEDPPAHGRRLLSDALYRLRQTIPEQWLHVQTDALTLHKQPDLWVDVWAFQQFAQADEEAHLAEAAALYQGDLVPDFEDAWLLPWREQLREVGTAVLHKLATIAENQRHFAQAQQQYERLLALDELNEPAHCGRLRCLAGQGNLKEAIAAHDAFAQLLRQEMHLPPAPDTQKLAQQLQAEWELQKQTLVEPNQTPFVGRVAERNQLLSRLDEAHAGRGGLVILLGEAGMGKTRLLESLAQSANWRGWQVAWGTSEEFALPAPYAPLMDALAAALPQPRVQQLIRLVPGWWLAFLARLLPDLATQIKLPNLPEGVGGQTEADLPRALQAILSGLQQIAPHLLLLDDVQWADPAIWSLLTALQPALNDLSLLIVVSGRANSLKRQEVALQAIRTWEQAGATVLHLEGLPPQMLADLAKAAGQARLSPADLAHLHKVSGGNPLLALNVLGQSEPITAVAHPQLLDMQRHRLAALDDATLLGLQAAAILGYRFDYALWESIVTGIGEGELPVLAGELEQRRFLILEQQGYRFPHDTLRACVYEDIPAQRRQLLHQRALVACAEFEPRATQSLLNHAVQGKVDTAVARYAHQAGQEALDRFAYREAIAHFSQTIETVAADDQALCHSALVGRAKAYAKLSEQELLAQDLQQLQVLNEQLPAAEFQIPVLKMQAEFDWINGAQAKAEQLAQKGLALAQTVADRHSEALFLEMLARVARNQGDYRLAQQWLEQARERYVAVGDQFGHASALDKLANLAYEAGQFAQSVTMHQQAAAIFRQMGAVPYEARTLSGEALAQKALGNYEQARQTHRRTLEIATTFGDRLTQWSQLVLLGNIAFELGDYATAVSWYQQALNASREIDNPRSVAMTLNNLGEAYREQAAWEEALDYYHQALALNRAKGFERSEAHTLNGIGLAQLGLGQLTAARQSFEEALALWQTVGERFKQSETLGGLALASLREADLPAAEMQLTTAFKLLEGPQVHPFWRRWVHFVAYRVYAAKGEMETAVSHLIGAVQAVNEIVRKLPADERENYWANVLIHQQITQAVQQHSEQQEVRLVKSSVPLGSALTEADYKTIRWTIAQPTDTLINAPVARRRHILQRLLSEAEAQGAAPTDADLAQALGVSRRTILRDMDALAAENLALPTRGRAG
ncbi:MAG: tetratricopeptide repeat protein [Ardenticatenaceae bacterium]|nr:tetratricopeptide repeat protein [Ardenticatenaceae bacterium]